MKNLEKELYFIFRDKYNEKWQKAMLTDILRLKAGEPVDYIIGWMPFLNTKIDLSFPPPRNRILDREVYRTYQSDQMAAA